MVKFTPQDEVQDKFKRQSTVVKVKQPAVTQPAVTQPAVNQPAVNQPAVTQPKDDVGMMMNRPVMKEEVPSGFLPYPENATMSYRGYYFGEVGQFEFLKGDLTRTFELVLKGIETSFNKMDLTLPDTLMLGLLRKIVTLGDTRYFCDVSCPWCNNSQRCQGNIGEFEFQDLNVPALPVVAELSFSKDPLYFQPLTVGKFLELVPMEKQREGAALITQMCVNKDFDEIYDLVCKATGIDSGVLNKIDGLLDHGLKPLKVFCENKKCDSFEVKIPFTVEMEGDDVLITPSHDFRKSVESKIRFGEVGSD